MQTQTAVSPTVEPINVKVWATGRLLFVRWTGDVNKTSIDKASADIGRIRRASNQQLLCVTTLALTKVPSAALRERLKTWNQELETQCDRLVFVFEADSVLMKFLRTFIEAAFFLSKTSNSFVRFARTGADAVNTLAPLAGMQPLETIARARAVGMLA